MRLNSPIRLLAIAMILVMIIVTVPQSAFATNSISSLDQNEREHFFTNEKIAGSDVPQSAFAMNSISSLDHNESEHIFTNEEIACLDYVPSSTTENSSDALIPINKTVNETRDYLIYYIIECDDGMLLTYKSLSSPFFKRSRYSAGNDNSHKYQKWVFQDDGDGNYIVRPTSKASYCLTVDPNDYSVSLQQYSSGSIYQKWKMYYSSNGNALKCVFSDTSGNNYKLNISGSSLYVNSSTYTPLGFFNVDWYIPTTDLSYNDFYLAPEQDKIVYPNKTPTNAICTNSWISWSSSDTTRMTVNGTGYATGVTAGSATLTFIDKITRVSGTCAVNVTQIANGTYFLKSKDTSRYVDIEDQNMANGTNIHQWDFNGGNSQRWIFTHLGDGYYSIKSANSTSNYYLGVQNDGTATNTQVVLRTGSLTDGMKWKVSVTTSGAYKITPKTGEPNDRVLAVGWYALNVNGIDIKQRDYDDDENYKDEWVFVSYGAKSFRVLPTNMYDSINCHGYVMFRNDIPSGWQNTVRPYVDQINPNNNIGNNDYGETIKNNISAKTKADFENWLTSEGYTFQYEDSFYSNGENRPLKPNQYRVVLRTGLHNILFTYQGALYWLQKEYDYHFWYQTYDGTWANKHGSTEFSAPEQLSYGVYPDAISTSGWDLEFKNENGDTIYTYHNFYDGNIHVYIITV